MNKIILYSFLFFCASLFSQTPQVNNHYYNYNFKNIDFDGFKYDNLYYETTPTGLLSFIENNKDHFSPELKSLLIKKVKKIKVKKIIGDTLGWSSYVIGGVIMFDSVLSGQDEFGKYDTKGALTGFGIAAIGIILKEILRPKNRHYYDFINTVNRENNKKINIEVTMNYNENFNFGLALNF